ncbi:hypothetical protein NDU88_001136 [Pleurodeles waltl]|uniref:Uncharacterized protein n=1 Tax=Pleurodeles waltl TaxID=8319 RepID=A0AAV7Q664_PLEWA|nr:hypothetical protein NDU88_001136 [Pleurodeles waltl]
MPEAERRDQEDAGPEVLEGERDGEEDLEPETVGREGSHKDDVGSESLKAGKGSEQGPGAEETVVEPSIEEGERADKPHRPSHVPGGAWLDKFWRLLDCLHCIAPSPPRRKGERIQEPGVRWAGGSTVEAIEEASNLQKETKGIELVEKNMKRKKEETS